MSGLFVMRPEWAHSCKCKSHRKLVMASEEKRDCGRVTERGEEAWIETADRWAGMRSYLGRSRFVPERATVSSRSEKSAEAVVGSAQTKGRTRESEVVPRTSKAMRQMPGLSGRSERQVVEARRSSELDKADPLPRNGSHTGAGCLMRP